MGGSGVEGGRRAGTAVRGIAAADGRARSQDHPASRQVKSYDAPPKSCRWDAGCPAAPPQRRGLRCGSRGIGYARWDHARSASPHVDRWRPKPTSSGWLVPLAWTRLTSQAGDVPEGAPREANRNMPGRRDVSVRRCAPLPAVTADKERVPGEWWHAVVLLGRSGCCGRAVGGNPPGTVAGPGTDAGPKCALCPACRPASPTPEHASRAPPRPMLQPQGSRPPALAHPVVCVSDRTLAGYTVGPGLDIPDIHPGRHPQSSCGPIG